MKHHTPFNLSDASAQFQTLAVTGTSAQSNAVTAKRIAIVAPVGVDGSTNNVAVYVAFGTNPTATTSSLLLAPGYNYFNFTSGWKVAAISGGTTTRISILDLD
jgi:hypothetical protein